MGVNQSPGTGGGEEKIRGYGEGPPWVFRGRALYQLHAVKAATARRFVPPELKLVEAFGYTLGGFFLAHYDGSPAGEFDEAVVIAGIVWNAPTSCAWAGRVLLGSEEARIHGRREVGLPSHLARFSHRRRSPPPMPPARPWWDARGWRMRMPGAPRERHSVDISQIGVSAPLCEIAGIPPLLRRESPAGSGDARTRRRWAGPSVQLSLPNFSGRTPEQPELLKYSCRLNCRVSVVATARVATGDRSGNGELDGVDARTRDVLEILSGRPLAAILFDDMSMCVEAPQLLELKASEAIGKTVEKRVDGPTVKVGLGMPGNTS